MIVALFGASCTGKTSIARALSAELTVPLRSCGDAVKGRASELSVAWSKLPDEQHRTVDKETREWCAAMKPCIVEGRFLDHVLAPLQGDTMLIRLAASKEARCARWTSRTGLHAALAEIEEHDEVDRTFRTRLYGESEVLAPLLVMDTSDQSVKACVRRVKSLLEATRG